MISRQRNPGRRYQKRLHLKRYIEVKERISEKISRARYHEMISREIHRGGKDVHEVDNK
jgi:hypothetical protein